MLQLPLNSQYLGISQILHDTSVQHSVLRLSTERIWKRSVLSKCWDSLGAALTRLTTLFLKNVTAGRFKRRSRFGGPFWDHSGRDTWSNGIFHWGTGSSMRQRAPHHRSEISDIRCGKMWKDVERCGKMWKGLSTNKASNKPGVNLSNGLHKPGPFWPGCHP